MGIKFSEPFRLVRGTLTAANAAVAAVELNAARELLSKLPPAQVVWDIERRETLPPWGDNIAPSITNLGNYFISSTGRDLSELLRDALEAAEKEGEDASIE